jgi:hypothetical protein
MRHFRFTTGARQHTVWPVGEDIGTDETVCDVWLIRGDRGHPGGATVKVDQVYAIRNRWDVVEYSIGKAKTERCVNALMPHFGAWPCWYVKSHTLNFNRGG